MDKAILHLSKDPIMAKLVDEHAPFEWKHTSYLYKDLLSAIVSQQLSVKAADTIWSRVEILLNNDFSPQNILETPDQKMREAGMSWAKIKYMNGVAEAYKNDLVNEEEICKMTDEEVILELTKLKGIGPWSVEMILIFTLKRPDVFPLGDLGIRNAVSKLYNVDRDDLKKIEKISLKWRPYRSTACRYLWKSLENE